MKESVYHAILDHITEHGYPPTIREICDAAGIKSTSKGKRCLRKLEADGKIEVIANSPRAIRLCEYDIELRPKVKVREEGDKYE